jgi:uncharacterized protein (DUF2126 family)/transglutaminase-like putative cysteine protease
MGIQVALNHRTSYRYDKAISLGPHVIRLRPAFHARTPIPSYSLDITPANQIINWQLDPFNNRLARVIFSGKTNELVIDVNLVADLSPVNPFAFFLDPGIADYPFTYAPDLAADLQPYLSTDEIGPRLTAFLAAFRSHALPAEKTSTVSLLLELNRKVRDDLNYETRFEHGVQTCEETLERRSGSCRDSAWLLVQALRNLGIAARFVSGYLIQLAGADDGPKTDTADLHAWAEAFLPGAGWIGLDPTSGMLAAEGHIPLVCTPSATQAAPVEGTAEPAKVDFSFSISVQRIGASEIAEDGLSDQEWLHIRKVAHSVDAALLEQDVRLTMGGEPTYVGIDEPESPQWNIDALGPIKRSRGLALIQALRSKIAPGGLLHYGQGKWYPGEALPRWALSCYWRLDGTPIWQDVQLIAQEDAAAEFGNKDALRFITALTHRLQVSAENVLPAYNSAGNSAEPGGFILPIRRRQPDGRLQWSSQPWFQRPEQLLLSFGSSPIGYRVPTEAVPWVAPDEVVYELDEAPFSDLPKLPARLPHRPELFETVPAPDPLPPVTRANDEAPVLIRPALCVEAREGRLHVFVPYTSKLPDYLDLIAAVEDTCRYLQMPVWVEGYPPAFDPRMRSFSLTPDPGVLEVNLPPTSNWDDLEHVNTLLDEEARANRLTAEKFNFDGSHLATGGGSHIVVGGATVLESPFLRRPDLLRSMVTFWQNHPALSYLFSGLYVGPTSQYPRVDEARLDALYELEVAFQNLPEKDCPPFIVDGLFRNLLVDVTGNSHRAEFCVDKMYPPEGYGLQLGLLELRAFEMAPNLRMSMLQLLLVRALVAMLWKTPFEGRLIRWGTALHDRFMLPIFVAQDMAEVLANLRRAGLNLEDRWFAPHLEFRFPKIGSVAAEGVELELRHALEPWHVLAEETVSGGTVRSVDSSLERMQVKLSGLAVESRYAVTCNGRAVPLQLTNEAGVAVAGVRYRARRLNASLHPTVPVHSPLVFNVIDRLRGCSIAECTYHTAAPDGRQYPGLPVNAAEAASRRQERFQVAPAAHIPMLAPEQETNPLFPMTLDMRLPVRGVKSAEPAS